MEVIPKHLYSSVYLQYFQEDSSLLLLLLLLYILGVMKRAHSR